MKNEQWCLTWCPPSKLDPTYGCVIDLSEEHFGSYTILQLPFTSEGRIKISHDFDTLLDFQGTDDEEPEENFEMKSIKRLVNDFTSSFGDSNQCLISPERDLLFTSGHAILFAIWSVKTGHPLRIMQTGSAESILSGISICYDDAGNPRNTGSLLVVTHFPDEESNQMEDSGESIFITCKVYNIDPFKRIDQNLKNVGAQYEFAEKKSSTEEGKEQETPESGQPLVYKSNNMSLKYMELDVLPTLVLASETNRSTGENVLTLYDTDDDGNCPVKTWSGDMVNMDLVNSFVTISEIKNWPQSNKPFLLHSPANVQALLMYTGKGVASKVFFDYKFVNRFLPNYYIPTSEGNVDTFGVVNEVDGYLVLIQHKVKTDTLRFEIVTYDEKSEKFQSDLTKGIIDFKLAGYFKKIRKTVEKAKILRRRMCGRLRLCQISKRAGYPNQIIVGFNETLPTIHTATLQDGRLVCWVGCLIIVEVGLNSQPQILKQLVIDYGPSVVFLRDGNHIMNYKIRRYDLNTGDIIAFGDENVTQLPVSLKDLDFTMTNDDYETEMEDEVSSDLSFSSEDEENEADVLNDLDKADIDADRTMLLNLFYSSEANIIYGQKHEAKRLMNFDFLDASSDSSAENKYSAQPPRCLMAFSTLTGKQVTNYMLENEPYQVFASSRERQFICFTSNEMVRAFDLSLQVHDGPNLYKPGINSTIDDFLERSVTMDDLIGMDFDSPAPANLKVSRKSFAVNRKLFFEHSGLYQVIEQAMFETANKRPADPIEYLANAMKRIHLNADF